LNDLRLKRKKIRSRGINLALIIDPKAKVGDFIGQFGIGRFFLIFYGRSLGFTHNLSERVDFFSDKSFSLLADIFKQIEI
jgi:hypothetical protein